MEMVSNKKIDCAKCGFEIDAITTRYCPSCGSPVEGAKEGGNKKRWIKAGLSYPLFLLLVGGLFTYLLIPEFTSAWKVNEQELDFKFELADQLNNPLNDLINEAFSYYFFSTNPFVTVNDTNNKVEFLNNKIGEWRTTCNEFKIKLPIYYSQKDLVSKSNYLCDNANSFILGLFNESLSFSYVNDTANDLLNESQNLTERIIHSDVVGYKRGISQFFSDIFQ